MLVFAGICIIEIFFAVYCIASRSYHCKTLSAVRITEFILFAVSMLSSVLLWGIQYYPVAVLLLLMAAVSLIRLLRKKENTRPFKIKRVIMKTVLMIFAFLLFTLPAILFPTYRDINPTGNFKVATACYSYTDPNRIETYTNTGEHRELNVELWYPQNAGGTYPLIVFSHGSFGVKSSNETLYNELASHGYVVCSIDHTYQCFFTTDSRGKTVYMDNGYKNEIMNENAQTNPRQSFEYYKKWMSIRTGDINFVIDYLKSQAGNKKSDTVYRLIDPSKIGVMGHSLGGSAVLGIGRTRKDISAVISLEAPFMCDIQGVDSKGNFIFNSAEYPAPVLNIYSDSSWGHLDQWPQYKENYILFSGKDKTAFNVHIRGVYHLGLTDFSQASPILTDIMDGHMQTASVDYCLKTINKVSLRFFDSYLKGEGKFDAAGTY